MIFDPHPRATVAASLALLLAPFAWTAPGQEAAKQKTAPAGQEGGPAPPGHAHRPHQGPERVQGRTALHRPSRIARVVGQPGGRPQGPADRLGPVREALPGHPAGPRGAGLGDQGRADPGRARRGAGPALGVRQPLRRRQRLGQIPERPLSGQGHRRRRRPRQGRAAPQARRQRRARAARRGPRARRQVALCGSWQRDQAS